MNSPRAICLGLGGFGGKVLRQLGPRGASCRLMWIDQRAETSLACSDQDKGECVEVPTLGLAGEEAREALLRLPEWREHFSWLPEGCEARWLSELGAYSTSGYRVLGRMSLTRSHRVLDARLRKLIRGLTGNLPPREAFLIASLDGGTGSGILADTTLLLRRLLPRTVFHALLLVPSLGLADRRRFEAGALATLIEVSELYRGHSFNLSFEGETADLSHKSLTELWQRVFLFSTVDIAPYGEAALRIAEVLSLLVDPEVSVIRSHWPDARADGEWARSHPFSTAGGVHGGLQLQPDCRTEREAVGDAPPEKEQVASNIASIPIDTINSTSRMTSDRQALDRKELEDELDKLYDAFRSLRSHEQALSHEMLRRIENDILVFTVSQLGHLGQTRSAKESVSLDQHIADLRTLQQEFDLREATNTKGGVRRWLHWPQPISSNFAFEQRVNIIRKILERVPYLPSIFTMLQAKTIGSSSSSPRVSTQGRRGVQENPPCSEAALARLEASFHTPVFSFGRPDASRRLRAALLVPPQIKDPEPWAAAVRHHLGVEPEIHPVTSGALRVWWEDLHHPLENIEGIQAMANAYLATPERALLHTDRAFQPKAEAWAEAHRS